MTDECAEAINYMEYYAGLVDAIIPDLEDHLADNVELYWFGKKIKGKRNVVNFIQCDQVNTLHLFTSILPISNIIYEKKERHRKHKVELGQADDVQETISDDTKDCCREITNQNRDKLAIEKKKKQRAFQKIMKSFDKITIVDYTKQREPIDTTVETDANIVRDDFKIHDKDDSDHLHKVKITSEFKKKKRKRKRKKINEIKLKKTVAPTTKITKEEWDQQESSVLTETSVIKYAKAHGRVEFIMKKIHEDPWSYYWISRKQKRWQRNCTLQIAYSCRPTDEESSKNAPCTSIIKERNDAQFKPLMPSLSEIIATNVSIPDVNNFGGYLKPLNYVEDREKFLMEFEAEMAQENPDARLPTVRYVGNKLTFKYQEAEDSTRKKKVSGANCQIHTIVYQQQSSQTEVTETADKTADTYDDSTVIAG